MKVKLGEVTSDSAVMTSEPVEPALCEANMAGRFLLVPASSELWPAADGVGGWVCKVLKVNRSTKIAGLQFADGKVNFRTSAVLEWKPLS